jgi:hypothetical protein
MVTSHAADDIRVLSYIPRTCARTLAARILRNLPPSPDARIGLSSNRPPGFFWAKFRAVLVTQDKASFLGQAQHEGSNRPMSKKFVVALLCGALGAIASAGAHAMPSSGPPAQAAKSDFTLVRNFCGLGFHRTVYGNCVRNGVYAAPLYAPPPVYVPPVVVPVACPYGYHLGPYGGRCIPYY